MRVLSERDMIKAIPMQILLAVNKNAWRDRTMEALDKLNLETATKEEVNVATGSPSWTKFHCEECLDQVDILVEFGEEEPMRICKGCLEYALNRIKSKE